MFDEFIDSRYFGIRRSGRYQPQHPRHLYSSMSLVRRHIRKPENREGRGCGLRMPLTFDGGKLHLLMLRHCISAFIAEHDDRKSGCQAEADGDGGGALRKLDMPPLEQVPSAHRKHEDSARHISSADRMDEFGLGDGVENDVPDRIELHSHRRRIEMGAGWVLHPG